jgi:hypothetical protein
MKGARVEDFDVPFEAKSIFNSLLWIIYYSASLIIFVGFGLSRHAPDFYIFQFGFPVAYLIGYRLKYGDYRIWRDETRFDRYIKQNHSEWDKSKLSSSACFNIMRGREWRNGSNNIAIEICSNLLLFNIFTYFLFSWPISVVGICYALVSAFAVRAWLRWPDAAKYKAYWDEYEPAN